MKIEATTVDEYLSKVPEERKKTFEELRKLILKNLPEGYVECMQYNMISYVVPFEKFPITYNKQPLCYLSLGYQKNHMALYMNNIYSDPELNSWFVEEYKATGKRLDMGKSCVRFRKIDNLPLDVIEKAIAATPVDKFIEIYKHAKKTSGKSKN